MISNVWISINISLKFVPRGPISNMPTLVQLMAWCRPGDKPLSEPMMVRLPTHICVTRPQWVKQHSEDSILINYIHWNGYTILTKFSSFTDMIFVGVIISLITFYHWLHQKLSKWQLPVQPVTKISSKWWHLLFDNASWNWNITDKMASIFADGIFKYILLNKNDIISIQIWMKFVPKSPIDNKPALVRVMAWGRTGDKPLSEPMMTQFTDAYMRH